MKIIYHATNNGYQTLTAIGVERMHEYYGDALYFSDNIDTAKYYGKHLFSLEVNDGDFDIIDAKGAGIKTVASELSQLLSEKKNVKIINVGDYELRGAQQKSILMHENDNEYKYEKGYFLKQELNRMSWQLKKQIEEAKTLGVTITPLKNIKFSKNKFSLDTRELTKDEAIKLSKMGFSIRKQVGRTPATATTYAIVDENILRQSKMIYDSGGTVKNKKYYEVEGFVKCQHCGSSDSEK